MEWIKHSLWIKLLVWEVCVCICACMCICVCEDVRTHACGSSIRFYFTVWWLRYCSERCGRLCWQNQSSDPAVSSPCVCARVCVRANECVCVCVCVCVYTCSQTPARAKAVLLLCELGVFGRRMACQMAAEGVRVYEIHKSQRQHNPLSFLLSLCHRKF